MRSVIWRDTGAFVGWFSLKYAGKSSDIEIGYRLLADAWGLGFATDFLSVGYPREDEVP